MFFPNYPYCLFLGLAGYYAFWAEILTPREAEVIPFVPQKQRHIHVGKDAAVVALR